VVFLDGCSNMCPIKIFWLHNLFWHKEKMAQLVQNAKLSLHQIYFFFRMRQNKVLWKHKGALIFVWFSFLIISLIYIVVLILPTKWLRSLVNFEPRKPGSREQQNTVKCYRLYISSRNLSQYYRTIPDRVLKMRK